MDVSIWIIVGVIIGFVIAVSKAIDTSNKKKAMEGHLGRLAEFSATQTVMASDGNTGLAIDEERKKICLLAIEDRSRPFFIKNGQLAVVSRVLSYRDVLSSQIFEDGITITRTVRTSQIGGALIGGLALGSVGALVGALSGKTQTSSAKVKQIDLSLDRQRHQQSSPRHYLPSRRSTRMAFVALRTDRRSNEHVTGTD